MSRFSGKCDFCDEIEIHGLDRVLNAKVYVGDCDKPLKLNSLADCIPYYPYVVVASFDLGGCLEFYLTSKSWVDMQEERYGYFACYDSYRKILLKEIEKYKKK